MIGGGGQLPHFLTQLLLKTTFGLKNFNAYVFLTQETQK